MGEKAKAGSSLAGDWDGQTLDGKRLEDVVQILQTAGHPIHSQALARTLTETSAEPEAPKQAVRVKKYDHRCDYQEGERVYVDNRYGRSFATITKIIRQPENAFCDKAFLVFDEAEYRTRWEQERSTPYFAINSGRTNATAVYVDAVDNGGPKTSRTPRLNATAVAKLGKAIDRALEADSRFQSTPDGWQIAELAHVTTPGRPHIQAEPGGAVGAALPQGLYKAPLLEVLDKMGEASIEDIKRNIQNKLKLGPADWEADKTGKIVWIHRLHAAIKHLKRVGAIESPSREVYRRVGMRKERSA